jgi:hypothetical protein
MNLVRISPGGTKECSPGREAGVRTLSPVQPRRGVRFPHKILRPSGAEQSGYRYPGLTAGATLFRPSGTIALYAILFLLNTPAFSQQRPLLTEDPRTIAEGTLTTEIGATYLTRARFPFSGLGGNELQLPVSGLHFSLGERAEFQLTGSLHNFLWVHEGGSGTRNDFGDVVVSTKMRIIDEKGRRPIIGFRPSVILPNSNDQKGIGTNTTQFFADVLAGKHFQSVYVFGSAGLGILDDTLHARAQQDVFKYGLAASVPVGSRVDLMSEIHGVYNPRRNPSPGGEDHSQIRLGLRLKSGAYRWDVAGIAGLTRLDPRIGVAMGLTTDFRLWK